MTGQHLELLELVRSPKAKAFRGFSDVIGYRIQHGRALEALRMLVAIGAAPELAHQIVDGWPEDGVRRLPGLEFGEEAACRLAHYVDDLSAYDWIGLLRRSLGGARRPVSDSRPQGLPPG